MSMFLVSWTIVDVSSLFRRTSFLSVAVVLWTGDDLIATRLEFLFSFYVI